MENLIEHKGKKYRVVDDAPFDIGCDICCFNDNTKMCGDHDSLGFPHCTVAECHFELVEETNPKE